MNEVATRVERFEPAPQPNNAMTPMEMLNNAIAGGASMEVLEKLMTLQERWEKNQGRKAFDNAMAEARAELPTILKNRVVDFTSAKGRTNYRHEDLAEVTRTVAPILAKHGLSFRWRTETPNGGPVSVTCILSHRDGHFEENTLSAGRDESGNKNNIQAIGSTVTYLQRYTLKAAIGVAASEDDDAGKSPASADHGPISDSQREAIQALIDETGSDIRRFCAAFGIEAVADLPAPAFGRATSMLNAKKKGKS